LVGWSYRIQEHVSEGALNWEAIGAIGELIGALAVVLSLIYLGFQITQNTRQLEQSERTSIAASGSASATIYRENRQYIYTSAEVAMIQWKGMADPQSLDEIAKYRFRLLMSNFVDANWDMYAQTVITGFSPEILATQGSKVLGRVLGSPGGYWFWQKYCKEYPEEFRAEVNRVLDLETAENKSRPQAD
jgi:hypothetical protein